MASWLRLADRPGAARMGARIARSFDFLGTNSPAGPTYTNGSQRDELEPGSGLKGGRMARAGLGICDAGVTPLMDINRSVPCLSRHWEVPGLSQVALGISESPFADPAEATRPCASPFQWGLVKARPRSVGGGMNCPTCGTETMAGVRWCTICHANLVQPGGGKLASPGKRLAAYVLDVTIPLLALMTTLGIGVGLSSGSLTILLLLGYIGAASRLRHHAAARMDRQIHFGPVLRAWLSLDSLRQGPSGMARQAHEHLRHRLSGSRYGGPAPWGSGAAEGPPASAPFRRRW